MKALSLWQPWASAIAAGLKCVETRHWPTNYRGPLAIAATKTTPRPYHDFFESIDAGEREAFARVGIKSAADLPRSAIVCTCILTDCVLMTPELIAATPAGELEWGLWAPGRYAWVLKGVMPLQTPRRLERCGRTLWNIGPICWACGCTMAAIDDLKCDDCGRDLP